MSSSFPLTNTVETITSHMICSQVISQKTRLQCLSLCLLTDTIYTKKAAEANHEEAIGLSFLSDWQRETHEFCRLIKERIEIKKINFRMFRR